LYYIFSPVMNLYSAWR